MKRYSGIRPALMSLLLLMAANGAQAAAKLYRWVDAEGKVHYSDRLPPEAVKQAREELNDQGMAVKKVERELTAAERAAQEAEQARQAELTAQAEEAKKRDQILLNSYPTEESLARSYSERFDLLEQSTAAARLGIDSQEKSLAELLAHAAELERAGKPVAKAISDSINLARQQVENQHNHMAKLEAERVALQQEFDQAMARYRDLKARYEAQLSERK